MAEQTTTAGWYADATKSGRERWWDGATWTARVREEGLEGVSWIAHEAAPTPVISIVEGDLIIDLTGVDDDVTADDDLVIDLTASDHVGAPVAAAGAFAPSRFVAPAVTSFPPLVRMHPRLRIVQPASEPALESAVERPHRRVRFQHVAVVAVVIVLVLGVAATAAAIIESRTRGSEPLPIPVGTRSYRDGPAGFALRFPRQWRILDATKGTGVSLGIGAADVADDEANVVDVAVGTGTEPFPLLQEVATDVTEQLQGDLPGVVLQGAARTRMAGGAAYRLELTDDESSAPTRIVQYVGTTTDLRPLTVTLTVRDEDSAPSRAQLRTFVRSIRSL